MLHKKRIFLAVLILFSFTITACGNTKNDNAKFRDSNVINVNGKGINKPAPQRVTKKVVSTNNNEVSYTILTKTYKDKDIVIRYPQIVNLDNTNKQRKINSIIKSEALKVLNYYKGDENNTSLEINYNIKLNNGRLLSIIYSGAGYVKGSAHPNNLFYSTNINVDNGTTIRLSNIVNINKTFIEKLKEKNTNTAGVFDNFTDEELIKMLVNGDSLDSIGTESQTDVFSYFTKDSLGVSLSVPHAIGDHVEFYIKYKDIINNLKNKNGILKDLIK